MVPQKTMAATLVAVLALGACKTGETTRDAAPAEEESASSEAGSRDDPAASGAPASAQSADPVGTSEEVTFTHGIVTLEGTLSLPEDVSAAAARPGVVLVHGSGPLSRDERVPGQLGMTFPAPVPVFAELAEHLQRQGYVVLRYDKRTCGPFNDCMPNDYPAPADTITPRDFIADAKAARAFLAGRPEVDGDKIVYVGHSQGGALALEALEAPFAGAVLLAANWRPIDQVLVAQRDQLRELMEAKGLPSGVIDAQLKGLEETIAQLEALRAGEEVPDQIGGASRQFWEASLEIAAARQARLAALDRPLVLIFGAYDWNVPSAEVQGWRQGVREVPEGVDVEIVVLEELTHAFNRITQPDWQKVTPDDIDAHVDPEALEAVADGVAAIVEMEGAAAEAPAP